IFEARFWTYWVSEPFGLSLKYALGDTFTDFLRYPLLHGRPTYLVAAAHVFLVTAAAGLLMTAAWRLWQARPRWGEWFVGLSSPTAFTQSAAFWGVGLLLTGSLLPIHHHYLAVTFPLAFLWLARLALPVPRGRAVLLGLCAVQLFVSASFLGYV